MVIHTLVILILQDLLRRRPVVASRFAILPHLRVEQSNHTEMLDRSVFLRVHLLTFLYLVKGIGGGWIETAVVDDALIYRAGY